MPRVLTDINADGVAEFAHFSADGELEALEISDDVGDVLDANMSARNDGSGGYGKTREWQHLARIPRALLRVWEHELGVPVDFLMTKEGFPLLLRKIKDRDFCNLRTDK